MLRRARFISQNRSSLSPPKNFRAVRCVCRCVVNALRIRSEGVFRPFHTSN
jgi:hypothetical protein